MNYANITVQYCLEDDGTNSTTSLKVTEDAVVYFVPINLDNVDYAKIKSMVDDGTLTIAEADEE